MSMQKCSVKSADVCSHASCLLERCTCVFSECVFALQLQDVFTMCSISSYFQSHSRASEVLSTHAEISTVLDVSCEYPESVFDLRSGRLQVLDFAEISQPAGRAESIAYSSLLQAFIAYDDLMGVVCNLPAPVSTRPIFNTQDRRPRTFITGACVRGGTAAIMSNFQMYPWVTRLVCSIARQQAPDFWFSSIAVNLNCQSAVHRDSNNHSILPSAVIPASMFTGGQSWVEDSAGSVFIEGVPGRAVELTLPCITFQSRLRHATLSWTGDRLVIVLYHIRQAGRLPEQSRDRLNRAGFHIYSSDVLDDPYL